MVEAEKINNSKKSSEEELKSLQKKASIMAVVFLLSSLLFLSSVITGNTIGNLDNNSSNWLGIILFILGLAASFVCFKKK